MSIMDAMDDALLGADDDELDYDLEKDEEDALLADDNYEDTYDETQGDENREEEPSQIEEDILDIDSNVRLDETEEDFGDQSIKENIKDTKLSTKNEPEEEEEIEEQKERNRFTTERNITVQRSTSNNIPDTLEKVAVPPVPQSHNNNRNGKFQRGNRSRGRGRQNHNRGSVFGRVGNPPTEGKTVLINPHFRGNVQASENARLVWDSNFQNFPQQRYPGPQMAQVAPFQSQPPQWANPYSEPNVSFNQHPAQPNYQEPPPPIQYNQPPEMINPGIRPLMQVSTQPPPFIPQQAPPQQPMGNWSDDQSYCEMFPQGNFRGQNTRYLNQQGHQPLIMNNPPNFNQQNNFPGRNNFSFTENQNIPNQNRPYINPNHPNVPPLIQMQQNYPQPPPQNFEQPPPFAQQTHFSQNRHVQPVYDQYNDPNQFQPITQFPSMQNNQNFQGGNFQPPASYDPNFIPNQPAQESFPPKQYNHPYNQNKQNNYVRHPMNQYNRSPPKRRSFENSSGSGDIHKKKKRSMEFSNLHEVPTVEIPDTTTEEKEEEDEDTKILRLQIEEQKKLREKVLRQKEERRKAAAALKAASENTSVPVPAGNLITTIKTINQPVQQCQQQPQQIQAVKQPNPQFRPPQQNQNLQQKNLQLQRQKQLMQQRKTQNQQHPHNIQVQTNQGRGLQQRRIQQKPNQANIVITQKTNQPQQLQHPQRIVVLNQQQQQQQQQQQKANAIRRVVLKGMNTVTETSTAEKSSQENRENLSSFLSNRKVISNSTETTAVGLNPTLVDTPVVVVSNLAAGTTDVKIRKLCQGLGPIQNIQMNSNQRQATIRFKTIISAHKFFKKYQRKIVDLSMIQVSLVPES